VHKSAVRPQLLPLFAVDAHLFFADVVERTVQQLAQLWLNRRRRPQGTVGRGQVLESDFSLSHH
jgi:hypothetical protein